VVATNPYRTPSQLVAMIEIPDASRRIPRLKFETALSLASIAKLAG